MSESAASFLMKVARSDEDQEARQEALSGLSQMNDDRAIEDLSDLYVKVGQAYLAISYA